MHTIEATVGAAATAELAAARTLDAARAAAAAFELFGSFMLGGEEFALPAAAIREVVNYPVRVIPVPLAPLHLDGVFTLRGAVIPVLNLARIFDPRAPAATAAQKIVIIDHDHILVGLLIDSLGEVLRVRPEQRSVLQYREGAPHAVIAGAIRMDDGARLLQILDANALVCIENVPQVRALQAATRSDRSRFQQQAGRRKCISFTVGRVRFAFEMAAIREIITVPEVKSSVMTGGLCLGRISFRGHPVALIDFAALMGFGAHAGAPCAERRILVAPIGPKLIGLLVDAVDSIFNYTENELMPVPLLSRSRATMFAGCVSREGDGDILCLNHEGIFSHAELVEISDGHVNLYQQEAQGETGVLRRAAGRGIAHVAFSLDTPWAVEMKQLREIIAYNPGMTRPPGMPAWVHGILNLRRQVITVISLRSLFGLAEVAPTAATRIVIVEHEGERYGLMVDSVDSIVQVCAGQQRACLRMMRGQGMGEHANVIDVVDASGNACVLNVLELPAFLANLSALTAA